MAPDSDGDYLKPGTLVDGKFEVRRLLGQGGMGAVVEATHLLRQARVALKFMSPHMLELPGVVERFLNEGVAASRINNEHVVKVLDVSELPSGQPYMVMEYLDGEDLEALLTREGFSGLEDVARAVHFILQVLRGLQVAHQAGIVHRDLKPANCYVVNNDGEPDFIKIVDFGISKVQPAEGQLSLTHEGSTMGTPLYVSLEQARDASDVDARSDLYSVAVILYELLCGQTPFMPKNMAELFIQLASVQPASLDTLRVLPHGLADVVTKGLAKGRAERYQSALEFATALAPYSDERSELVLRQMLQRGSARPSRSPSGMPSHSPSPMPAPYQTKTGTLITASGNLPARRINSGTEPVTPPPPPPHRATVAPLSRTHALGSAADSPPSRRPLAWAFGALLVLGAGSAALAFRNHKSVATAPLPALLLQSAPIEGAAVPANDPAAVQAALAQAEPAQAPNSAAVPSATAGAQIELTAERAELTPNTPLNTNTSSSAAVRRAPEPQRQNAPQPTHRPELKQIEIER